MGLLVFNVAELRPSGFVSRKESECLTVSGGRRRVHCDAETSPESLQSPREASSLSGASVCNTERWTPREKDNTVVCVQQKGVRNSKF